MRTRLLVATMMTVLVGLPVLHTQAAPRPLPAVVPQLTVTPWVGGLVQPWDMAFTPGGDMLFTERPGRINVRLRNGTVRQLAANLNDLWVSGETGLMGIEVDPAYTQNRRVYTCQGTLDNSNTVQVIAWVADVGLTQLTRVNDPLVGGIDGSSGRHGGCQLRIDAAGHLRIGTGDAAVGTNPQNRNQLAGKTLRVDRFNGAGIAGNAGGGDSRVYTYGHRNVQGLAVRANGDVFSVEHGTGVDDEINRLQNGGNYGWDPVPGYNESRPMTDLNKFPNAIQASWKSGDPTIAPSGATFLAGAQWGDYNGALAVSVLKNQELRIYRFSGNSIVSDEAPAQLDGDFGRLRAAELGPDGALYVSTANGSNDVILRVAPVVTGGYVPLNPARLLDSRGGGTTIDGQSAAIGLRGTGSTTELVVTGRGGVAAGATAVVLNLTVTEPRSPGFATVWPCGSPRPNASNVNYGTGRSLAAAVISKVGAGGKVCLYTQKATHLVVDVNGFFPAGSPYASRLPARLLDTRPGEPTIDGQGAGGGTRPAGTTTEVVVGGRAGVPANANAAVLNVTATQAQGTGFVAVWPCGSPRPNASTLNLVNGATVSNLVVAKLGTGGGKVCVYNQSPTQLVVDLSGHFPAGPAYGSLNPARLLDSRGGPTVDGQGSGGGTRAAGSTTQVVVAGRGGVPPTALAAVLNVTAVAPGGGGFIVVWPCGVPRPDASNLNLRSGVNRSNAVVANIGADGKVCLYTSSPTDLVVDVNGYFP